MLLPFLNIVQSQLPCFLLYRPRDHVIIIINVWVVISLHACRYLLKDKFARYTGYNEAGELNNIIIIYPQAVAVIDNPMGCWDWWGYTVKYYGK